MKNPISKAEVEHVSLLARLRLTDEEIDVMTAQLGAILGYVKQLEELDTKDVEPMAHAMEFTNIFRDDEVIDGLPTAEALANAPSHDGECYRVPAVLGE